MNRRFYDIIGSSKPVLVDFYTDWCMPCKQMEPVLKSIKGELKDNIRIIKVNVDNNPFIASRYHIRAVPTLMIFQCGKQLWSGSGLRSPDELKRLLTPYLKREVV